MCVYGSNLFWLYREIPILRTTNIYETFYSHSLKVLQTVAITLEDDIHK